MVPAASIFIVSDNDDGVVGVVTVGLNRADESGDVLLPPQEGCIAGVFVVWSQRLDERDRREGADGQVAEERLFSLQVRGRPGGRGV